MPVLTFPVQLFDGFTVFSATSGAVDIDDDNQTFVLSKTDASGNRIETVFNTPINQVTARGSATRVRLVVNGVRKMIDFSLAGSMVQGFGIVGEIAGGVLNSRSGVAKAIAALRHGGANVRYLGYGARIAITWGIVLVVFIVTFATIFGLALGQQ